MSVVQRGTAAGGSVFPLHTVHSLYTQCIFSAHSAFPPLFSVPLLEDDHAAALAASIPGELVVSVSEGAVSSVARQQVLVYNPSGVGGSVRA